MTPHAPVQDFRVPSFADNGYTDWVLQGGQGIYDSAAQIRIQAMALRQYSADERMALELSIESPLATFLVDENRAFSDSRIAIVGPDFSISGLGWTWSSQSREDREIQVQQDTVAHFTQSIADSLVQQPSSDVSRRTDITSAQLLLRTTAQKYDFTFIDQVHVISGEMDLRANQLQVLADAQQGKGASTPGLVAPGVEAVQRILAIDSVVIKQGDRLLSAERAELFPRQQRSELLGAVRVELPDVVLSGAEMQCRAGELVLTGTAGKARAQMILSGSGGLGLEGRSGLTQQTLVRADSIILRELACEHFFDFSGSVEVESGVIQLTADRMTIQAPRDTAGASLLSSSQAAFAIGAVSRVWAEGQVQIHQLGQVARGDEVTFYPAEERAVLVGNARLVRDQADVSGQQMDLQLSRAIVTGDTEQAVRVRLAPLADLGYRSKLPELEPSAALETVPLQNTELSCLRLQMMTEAERTVFRFTESVVLAATNLDLSCERMDVWTGKVSSSEPALEVQRIEAFDQVEIIQGTRVATSDAAYIWPISGQGKVVLEGNSVVADTDGRVSGYRMTLLEGERRAIVETGGAERPRNTVTLPSLQLPER